MMTCECAAMVRSADCQDWNLPTEIRGHVQGVRENHVTPCQQSTLTILRIRPPYRTKCRYSKACCAWTPGAHHPTRDVSKPRNVDSGRDLLAPLSRLVLKPIASTTSISQLENNTQIESMPVALPSASENVLCKCQYK